MPRLGPSLCGCERLHMLCCCCRGGVQHVLRRRRPADGTVHLAANLNVRAIRMPPPPHRSEAAECDAVHRRLVYRNHPSKVRDGAGQ